MRIPASEHEVLTDVSVEGSVVFVGFGATAKERDYDDYAGTDVKGKIVLVLHGAPAKLLDRMDRKGPKR